MRTVTTIRSGSIPARFEPCGALLSGHFAYETKNATIMAMIASVREIPSTQRTTVVLLTLLGAAGEALGYDQMLKTNTTKRRVHSLLRQGCMLYDLIPMMPESRLRQLMQRFSRMLHEPPLFADGFGPV
jgi:hypothetical protein